MHYAGESQTRNAAMLGVIIARLDDVLVFPASSTLLGTPLVSMHHIMLHCRYPVALHRANNLDIKLPRGGRDNHIASSPPSVREAYLILSNL